jgi:hypothetical protein
MTTTALHLEVERSRFAHLLLEKLSAAVPAALASLFRHGPRTTESDPLLRAAREAEAVREMARGYAHTDPGFAADLFAAAARHEAEAETAAA